MAIAEPNRKDILFFSGKSTAMRNCHNSANEKSLYFEFSIPPMDTLLTIVFPTFFSPLQNSSVLVVGRLAHGLP